MTELAVFFSFLLIYLFIHLLIVCQLIPSEKNQTISITNMVLQNIENQGGEYSSEFFVKGGGGRCRRFLQILTSAARFSKS